MKRIKPQFRNAGSSLGLEYPYVFGDVPGIGYCVWRRDNGLIDWIWGGTTRNGYKPRPDQRSIFGSMETLAAAERLNAGWGYDPKSFNPAEYDAVE